MIHWLFLSLFWPLIYGSYVYNVKVDFAENLPDEDPDAPTIWGYQAWVNKNDPYISIIGYGSGGDDKIKFEQTKILEGDETPEWNEEFEFDDADSNGPYTKFLFKAYDDDSTMGFDINDRDYLGETRYVQVTEIPDCDSDIEFKLPVSRDGKECGLLVFEISKDGCEDEASPSSSGGYGSDNDGTDTTTQSTRSGKGGGGGGKNSAAYAGYEQADGDCLVGDIKYVNGQSIGIIGETCASDSDTGYSGILSYCIDGEIKDEVYNGDCDEEYSGSKCCQKGDPDTFGGAVCLAGECVPYNGDDYTDDDKSCRVGDIMYTNGQTIGLLGDTCNDDGNSYSGRKSVCVDGEVQDEDYTGDCDTEYSGSSCCQIGPEGTIGAAVCIKDIECNEYGPGPMPFTSGSTDGSYNDGSCLLDDIVLSNGDSTGYVGYTCSSDGYSNTAFTGKEGICVDGQIEEKDYSGECGEDTVCCQQGEPGTIGAAVCIKESDCVEYVSTEYGIETGSESSESTGKGKGGGGKNKDKRRLLNF